MTQQANIQLNEKEVAVMAEIFQRSQLSVQQLIDNAIYAGITKLQEQVYAGNVAAGWWTNIQTNEPKAKGDVELILSKLALVHSEVSEGVEGVRKGKMDDHLSHRPMIEVELADAVIRILDLCGHEGYDLSGAIREKLAYNAQRADHKIENRLKDGGKKA